MNKLINQCSLKDTTILRNLILENPELPLIIFCGEGVWNGEYRYCQADASKGEIEELTLYGDKWLNKEDYEEELYDDLGYEEEYKNMSDEEYTKMIDKKVAETEFVKAIVLWVG
jgi:hypothetical protein